MSVCIFVRLICILTKIQTFLLKFQVARKFFVYNMQNCRSNLTKMWENVTAYTRNIILKFTTNTLNTRWDISVYSETYIKIVRHTWRYMGKDASVFVSRLINQQHWSTYIKKLFKYYWQDFDDIVGWICVTL